ncbi:MAG: hypothetical protein JSS74_03900 [Actinobacteria bacterium]|nr:hypothetical protein [Actinomycetota bacterium]
MLNTGIITPIAATPIELLRTHETMTSATLQRAWRRGDLTRVVPGVFAETTGWDALAPWDRYLARAHAVALSQPGIVFCGITAAALRGVFLGRQGDPILVMDPDRTSRISGAVRVLTSTDTRAIDEIDGILLTSAGDTIVDLARTVSPGAGLAYADALLRRSPDIVPAQLPAINESRLSSRNRRRARWALDRVTGIPESVMESLSLAAIEFAGFERPELQVTFTTDEVEDRADFYWRSRDLIGEADGDAKYSGEFGDPTEAILKEKRREARLQRHVTGRIRWGWSELRDLDPLIDILRTARVPRVAPADQFMLASLRDALPPRR